MVQSCSLLLVKCNYFWCLANIYQTEEKGSLFNESSEQNQSQLVEEQVCEVELVDDSDNFSARYSNQISKSEQIIYDNKKTNRRLDNNITCDKTQANPVNPGPLEKVCMIYFFVDGSPISVCLFFHRAICLSISPSVHLSTPHLS